MTEDGKFILRPSSLTELSDNPFLWYKKHILNQSTFNGNHNTVLGTLLHARIENIYNGLETNQDDEFAYLELHKDVITDSWLLLAELDDLWNAWLEDYYPNNPAPTQTEFNISFEPIEGILFQGTVDALISNDTIVDWKSTTKTKSSIGDYWMQLYMYAIIARANGYNINKIRVVYIQKKGNLTKNGKQSAAKSYFYEEEIDENKMNQYKEWLKMQLKKINIAIKDEEMGKLLFTENLLSFRKS